MHAAGVDLSTDLSRDDAIPCFLWDDPVPLAELRRRLSGPDRYRLLGTILREAREPDVWLFTTPEEVVREWTRIDRISAGGASSGDFCWRNSASSGWSISPM